MIKKFSILTLIIIMLFSFSACSSEEAKNVDLSSIKNEILEKTGATPLDFTEDSFNNYYGIEGSKLKQNSSYQAQVNAYVADEIVLVEAIDEEAAKFVEETLKSCLEQKISQLTGYDPDSLAVAKGTTVHRDGNYVAMFFSQSRKAMEDIYDSYF